MVLSALWFRRKWSPERRLQTRFARVVPAVKAHAGIACTSTTTWKVENDARSGESLMSCQHCTSLAGPGSGSDGSKAGRG
jgi:hypothetical protein